MHEFFLWFVARMTDLWGLFDRVSFSFTSMFSGATVHVTYGGLIIGFIITGFVVTVFWRGAKT